METSYSPGDNASHLAGVSLLSRSTLLAGSTLLFLYASLIILHSASLLSGFPLNNATTLLAILFTLIYGLLLGIKVYRMTPKHMLFIVLGVILVIIFSGLVSSYAIDISHDGRNYHQKAVRWLANGWNPIQEELEPKHISYNAFLNAYPRGPWIVAASIFNLTGNLEAGKLFHFVLIVAVFCIAFAFLLRSRSLKMWLALLLSFFLAANPVSVYQSLSFYVDGQVSSLFIILVLLIFWSVIDPDIVVLSTIFSAVVIGLNVKFTGTAYAVIILAALVVSNWLVNGWRKSVPLLITLAAGCIVGVLIVGFNPYVTNTLRHGHPFYPLYGDSGNLKQIYYDMSGQMPLNMKSESQPGKLFISIFSRSQNTYQGTSGPLKNPFTISMGEIKTFGVPDTRIGGWGPLYGAALVTALILLIPLFVLARRNWAIVIGIVGLITITSLLNSEVWWARFSPQLWLIPVVVLIAMFLGDNRTLRLFASPLAVLILVNILLVAGAYLGNNFIQTTKTRAILEKLSLQGEPVLVYYGTLDATATTLARYHIPYQVVDTIDQLPCPTNLTLEVFYSLVNCQSKSAP